MVTSDSHPVRTQLLYIIWNLISLVHSHFSKIRRGIMTSQYLSVELPWLVSELNFNRTKSFFHFLASKFVRGDQGIILLYAFR